MKPENIKGFLNLKAKSLAVVAGFFSSLLSGQIKAQVITAPIADDDNTITYESYQNKILKPKLVLKVNMANPDQSLFAMHRSHSSHSSHSSHASHSSHSSHYSSSSYTPSEPAYTPPPPPPPKPQPVHSPATRADGGVTGDASGSTISYEISRTLYKGCKGRDVEALQALLKGLKYDLEVTGYFGDKTEFAVKDFQRKNDLEPDGRVGEQTLALIKSKYHGIPYYR